MTGVTTAFLNVDVYHSAASDRLNSFVRNGAMSLAICFSSETNSGSAADFFVRKLHNSGNYVTYCYRGERKQGYTLSGSSECRIRCVSST